MEWTQIIEQLGGGLSALVIAGLAFVAWHEKKRADSYMERMLAMSQKHVQDAMTQAGETSATLGKMHSLLEQNILILKARGGSEQ